MRVSRIAVAIVALAAVLMLAALWLGFRALSPTYANIASSIEATCESQENRSSCYEEEVPKLYPQYSVPQIFNIVRVILHTDSSYQFCHVLAHKVGERVVAEDPTRWKDAIPLNPTDGLCSNGFIHGVIGGRFRAEVLDDATLGKFVPDFRTACEAHDGWQPSDLDRAMCYHGMGHLYDFITNADLNKALSLCEETTTDQFRRVCREGVFMQIYQPLEPDDYELIAQMPVKPTPNTVRAFCARFGSNPENEGACLRESWPLHPGMTDGTGVTAFCTGQPNAEQERACYQSASAIIGRMSLGDTTKAAAACTHLTAKWQSLCFETTAQAVLEENRNDASKALALCSMAPQEATARLCMATLSQRAPFIFGENADEMRRFCDALPQDMRAGCGYGG